MILVNCLMALVLSTHTLRSIIWSSFSIFFHAVLKLRARRGWQYQKALTLVSVALSMRPEPFQRKYFWSQQNPRLRSPLPALLNPHWSVALPLPVLNQNRVQEFCFVWYVCALASSWFLAGWVSSKLGPQLHSWWIFRSLSMDGHRIQHQQIQGHTMLRHATRAFACEWRSERPSRHLYL